MRLVLVPTIAVGVGLVPSSAASAAVQCGPSGNAQLTEQPWPLRRLNPAAVWPLTRGFGVTVAVIDSGVSATHPVLRFRVREGKDYVDPRGNGQCDQAGHGTVVAGIIAGEPGYGPFAGIAPASAILPIRVVPDSNKIYQGLSPRIAEAIRWAVQAGAKVINLSLTTDPSPELAAAVEYAHANDVVLVAAAGNVSSGGASGPAYPAAYDNVVAVAGVDPEGSHVGTSMVGGYVDLAAPGVDIIGPAPGGGYVRLTEGGTSFAAAYVSGAAALVRSYYPSLSADEVVERLIATADRPPEGYNDEVGYGVVNAYRAVAVELNAAPAPVEPAQGIPPVRPIEDPLAAEKRAAAWTGALTAVVFLAVLFGNRVIRAGRRRGWRPGTPVT